MITNFLSNRTNLTILQFVMYVLIGYVMFSHLEWVQLIIMYVVIAILQFVTHLKAVADGMVYNQLINTRSKEFRKFINE